MYAVKCYNADGKQFGDTNHFDNIDDARRFAYGMTDDFIVHIVTPYGTTICLN